jgi:hypothetical protein
MSLPLYFPYGNPYQGGRLGAWDVAMLLTDARTYAMSRPPYRFPQYGTEAIGAGTGGFVASLGGYLSMYSYRRLGAQGQLQVFGTRCAGREWRQMHHPVTLRLTPV